MVRLPSAINLGMFNPSHNVRVVEWFDFEDLESVCPVNRSLGGREVVVEVQVQDEVFLVYHTTSDRLAAVDVVVLALC